MQARDKTLVSLSAGWIGLVAWLAATSAAEPPDPSGRVVAAADDRGAAPQPGATSGFGPRCLSSQDGAFLCLQRLQDSGSGLRGLLTYGTPTQEVKLADAPTLTVDGVKLPLSKAAPFADTDEQLSMIAVIQLAGRQKDKDAFPILQHGLGQLVQEVARLRQARIGFLGYNVTRASYQPNVELGDAAALGAVVQGLQLPDIKALSFELHDALDEAVSRLEHEPASRRKLVVVFTDGEEKDRARAQLFQKLARRANQADIVVDAIMFPSPNEPKDFLRVFVESTGGAIRRSRDLPTLGAAFDATVMELTRQTVATFLLDRAARLRIASLRTHQIELRQGALLLKSTWPVEVRSATVPAVQRASTPEPSSQGGWLIWCMAAAALAGGGLLLFFRRDWRLPWVGTSPVAPPRAPPPPPPPPSVSTDQGNSPPQPAPGGSPRITERRAICWLYEVKRQRTHVVDRFPFTVGNDLDCDLVLGGLDQAASVCVINSDGRNFYLQSQQEGTVPYRRKLLTRREVLPDRAEFAVGTHRLVIFETPLTD